MRFRGKKGFALIEVVFAFAILEMAILAIISAFPVITRMNKKAWNKSVAVQLAQEKMEEILAGNHAIWSTGTIGSLEDDQLITQAKLQGQYDNPTALSDCTRIWWGEQDPKGDTSIQVIYVKVFWMDGRERRSAIITTLYYR